MNKFVKNASLRVPGCVALSSRRQAMGTALWSCVCVVLIVALSSFYVVEINGIFSQGYAKKELQERKAELAESVRKLEVQSTELRSFASIKERVADLGMQPVRDATYVASLEESVALR